MPPVTSQDPTGDAVDQVPASHDDRGVPRRWPMWAALATLVVSNVVANEVLAPWAYIPWNLAIALALVALAVRADDRTMDDLGMARRRVPSGLRWGGVVATGVLVAYLIGLALPVTRDLFNDERADVGTAQVLWRALVAIPLGTVVMEEVAFRGVLPAMFRHRTEHTTNGALRADVGAAILFGFWHVLPSLDLSDANPVFRDLLPAPLVVLAAVASGVVATAAAGMVLSWLRNRSGSLVAPAMLHCSINSIGYVLAWLIQR